jgi:hypothetical protein
MRKPPAGSASVKPSGNVAGAHAAFPDSCALVTNEEVSRYSGTQPLPSVRTLALLAVTRLR